MIQIPPIIYQPDITSKFDLNIETDFAMRPKDCFLCAKIKEKATDLSAHLRPKCLAALLSGSECCLIN